MSLRPISQLHGLCGRRAHEVRTRCAMLNLQLGVPWRLAAERVGGLETATQSGLMETVAQPGASEVQRILTLHVPPTPDKLARMAAALGRDTGPVQKM